MNGLIKLAIKQPIAVAAMVFLIIAFGLVALQKIPIQMTPDIDKPILQVRVSWPGASPEDVEREVVTRLELAVASLSGIENVESDSRFGSGIHSKTCRKGIRSDGWCARVKPTF